MESKPQFLSIETPEAYNALMKVQPIGMRSLQAGIFKFNGVRKGHNGRQQLMFSYHGSFPTFHLLQDPEKFVYYVVYIGKVNGTEYSMVYDYFACSEKKTLNEMITRKVPEYGSIIVRDLKMGQIDNVETELDSGVYFVYMKGMNFDDVASRFIRFPENLAELKECHVFAAVSALRPYLNAVFDSDTKWNLAPKCFFDDLGVYINRQRVNFTLKCGDNELDTKCEFAKNSTYCETWGQFKHIEQFLSFNPGNPAKEWESKLNATWLCGINGKFAELPMPVVAQTVRFYPVAAQNITLPRTLPSLCSTNEVTYGRQWKTSSFPEDCPTKMKVKDLEETCHQLQISYDNFDAINTELKAENEELQRKVSALVSENKKLQEEIIQLEAVNGEYLAELMESKDKVCHLLVSTDHLKQQLNTLQHEHACTVQQHQQVTEEHQQVVEEHRRVTEVHQQSMEDRRVEIETQCRFVAEEQINEITQTYANKISKLEGEIEKLKWDHKMEMERQTAELVTVMDLAAKQVDMDAKMVKKEKDILNLQAKIGDYQMQLEMKNNEMKDRMLEQEEEITVAIEAMKIKFEADKLTRDQEHAEELAKQIEDHAAELEELKKEFNKKLQNKANENKQNMEDVASEILDLREELEAKQVLHENEVAVIQAEHQQSWNETAMETRNGQVLAETKAYYKGCLLNMRFEYSKIATSYQNAYNDVLFLQKQLADSQALFNQQKDNLNDQIDHVQELLDEEQAHCNQISGEAEALKIQLSEMGAKYNEEKEKNASLENDKEELLSQCKTQMHKRKTFESDLIILAEELYVQRELAEKYKRCCSGPVLSGPSAYAKAQQNHADRIRSGKILNPNFLATPFLTKPKSGLTLPTKQLISMSASERSLSYIYSEQFKDDYHKALERAKQAKIKAEESQLKAEESNETEEESEVESEKDSDCSCEDSNCSCESEYSDSDAEDEEYEDEDDEKDQKDGKTQEHAELVKAIQQELQKINIFAGRTFGGQTIPVEKQQQPAEEPKLKVEEPETKAESECSCEESDCACDDPDFSEDSCCCEESNCSCVASSEDSCEDSDKEESDEGEPDEGKSESEELDSTQEESNDEKEIPENVVTEGQLCNSARYQTEYEEYVESDEEDELEVSIELDDLAPFEGETFDEPEEVLVDQPREVAANVEDIISQVRVVAEDFSKYRPSDEENMENSEKLDAFANQIKCVSHALNEVIAKLGNNEVSVETKVEEQPEEKVDIVQVAEPVQEEVKSEQAQEVDASEPVQASESVQEVYASEPVQTIEPAQEEVQSEPVECSQPAQEEVQFAPVQEIHVSEPVQTIEPAQEEVKPEPAQEETQSEPAQDETKLAPVPELPFSTPVQTSEPISTQKQVKQVARPNIICSFITSILFFFMYLTVFLAALFYFGFIRIEIREV